MHPHVTVALGVKSLDVQSARAGGRVGADAFWNRGAVVLCGYVCACLCMSVGDVYGVGMCVRG